MKGKQIYILVLLFLVLGVLVYQRHDRLVALLHGKQPGIENPSLHTSVKPVKHTLKLDANVVKSIERFTRGVKVAPSENSISYAIQLDHGQGRQLLERKKYRETYQVYQKVLKISYDNNNLMGMSIGLGVMGYVLKAMNENADALDVTVLAYQVALKMGNKNEYGVHEITIARLMDKVDRSMALLWRLKAREHLETTPYIQDRVTLLLELADDLEFFQRDDEALNVYYQAYELSKTIGNNKNLRQYKKNAVVKYALALSSAKKCDAAIPLLKDSLDVYNTDADKAETYYKSMLSTLAGCYGQQGQVDLARQFYLQAYVDYELLRSLEADEQKRAEVDKNNMFIVNNIVDEGVKARDLDAALLALETNKARTLADIQLNDTQKVNYQKWRELKLKQARELSELFDLNNEDQVPARNNWREMMNSFFEMADKYQQEVVQIKLDTNAGDTLTADRMSQNQLDQIKNNIPADTAVLSVFTRYKDSIIFLITQHGVQYFESDLSGGELRQLVRVLQTTVLNPGVDYYREPAMEIYNRVFAAPLNSLGPGVQHIIYSPDDTLTNLPLGILYDGKRFLAERFTLTRVPSLRYLDFSQTTRPVRLRSGITCVDPDIPDGRLPFQRDTSDMLKSRGDVKIHELAGEECNENNLRNAITAVTDGTFLHVGAHGTFVSWAPMQSGILLSGAKQNPGLWNVRDMATVDMGHINLVTLSSCETGIVDVETSRDIFGILRALFYAGVGNVVAPSWSVEDLSTSAFMQLFYSHYLKTGSVARSVQAAQQDMLRIEKYRHPFYWGAFINSEVRT